jgi:hypothetical protein
MKAKPMLTRCRRTLLSALCALVLVPGDALALPTGWQAIGQASASVDAASRIPPDQLDSLVAPIALYPDPLLAQTLAASTYPLEILQLQQWLARNPGLQDQALADAVARQTWDPSVQAMAALPDVVKLLANDIQWTTDLGNAFLAQQGDVMDAVQRMRQKAQQTGNLQSTPQQTVETQVVESQPVIVIEPADPQVVYVPSYNPVAVYGPPVYPYPALSYPSWGHYAAGAAISWGVGVAMGSFWRGGWGWGAGWGGRDLTVNNNNFFNRNANVNAANRRANISNNWQHNPQHRGGAPYSDRATANRFGGTARGDSLASRQANARQQVSRQGGNLRSNAVGTSGAGNRAGAAGLSGGTGGLGNRAGGTSAGNLSNRAAGTTGSLGNRAAGTGAGNLGNRAAGTTGSLGNRAGGAGISAGGAGGANRVGTRDLSRGAGGGNANAFGGGQSFNGSRARASSDRGFSSMQGRSGSSYRGSGGGSFRSGGGGSRGGGFRGGGSRGGGGRSRGGRR